jgi:hypothetical protein
MLALISCGPRRGQDRRGGRERKRDGEEDLVGNLALGLHHELEHLVVGPTGEHDVASEEFVETHTHGPQVNVAVVWQSEDDLWSSIETTHQIGSGIIARIRLKECGTEVTQLHLQRSERSRKKQRSRRTNRLKIFTNNNVVWFDVSMDDPEVREMAEGDEELSGIHPHGCHVDPHVLPKFFESLT